MATAAACAATLHRSALWQVVRTCVVNAQLIGGPFPCLKVDIAAGAERGWAVLRPPFGAPDTILTPTRPIAGLEDSWLRGDDAPNYFAAAWEERALVKARDGAEVPAGAMALGVNSRATRTQDQLHIHIGCLRPRFRRAIDAFGPQLPPGAWAHIGGVAGRGDYRALRVSGAGLAGVNVFARAAEAYGDEGVDLADQIIVVAPLQGPADGGDFVILTGRAGEAQLPRAPSADEFIDPACPARR